MSSRGSSEETGGKVKLSSTQGKEEFSVHETLAVERWEGRWEERRKGKRRERKRGRWIRVIFLDFKFFDFSK